MSMSIIVAIVFFVLLVAPTSSASSAFLKAFGIIVCSMVFMFNTDWNGVKEVIDLSINNFYEWLMIKADNDPQKANRYMGVFIIAIMQPIIFGLFFFYKKVRGII